MGLYLGGLNTGDVGVGVGGGDIWNVDWVIYLGAYIRDLEGGLIYGRINGILRYCEYYYTAVQINYRLTKHKLYKKGEHFYA